LPSIGWSYEMPVNSINGLVSGPRRIVMFMALFLILLLLWAGGFLVFHVSAALIHLLLLFAIVSLFFHLFRGRTA